MLSKFSIAACVVLLVSILCSLSTSAIAKKKTFQIPPIRVAVLPLIDKTDEQPFFQDLVQKRFNEFLQSSNVELISKEDVAKILKSQGYDQARKEFPDIDTLRRIAILTNADDVVGLSTESITRIPPSDLDVTYKLQASVTVKIIEYQRYKDEAFTYEFSAKGESTNAPYEGASMEKAISNATINVLNEAFKSYIFSGFSSQQ